uniref:NADH-ubiquinone oxidoreductase chain 6 n=1 Tax=Isoscelipteron pectinatum TaxID=2856572 RepID=A0A8F8KK86_9NEOP|nr:NADH dehydrogenase subunit 6 [Isoscelipteron pectinatum]
MNQMLSSLSLMISLNFIKMNHPLSMGLNLMIQTIIISLICGMMNYTYWFSYILFLIMIGGMLVLFIYVTSLASNELFSFSSNNLITMSVTFILIMLILMLMKENNSLLLMNTEIMKYLPMNIFNEENSFNLIKIYNNPTMNITLLMINYLLLTLIIVVKITNINYGSLRKTN